MIQVHVDLADLVHHAKAARRRIEESDEGLRQDVLTSMLLNVVQTARPINAAFHWSAEDRS